MRERLESRDQSLGIRSRRLLTSELYPLDLSESGLERTRRVPDLRVAVVRPDHGDHIKPRRRLHRSVAAEVVPRGLGDLVAAGGVGPLLGGGGGAPAVLADALV